MNEALRAGLSGACIGLQQAQYANYPDKLPESPCDQALKKIHAAIARLNAANSTLNSRISKVVPQMLAEGTNAQAAAPEPGTSSLITELFSIARQLDQQAQGVEFLSNRIEL